MSRQGEAGGLEEMGPTVLRGPSDAVGGSLQNTSDKNRRAPHPPQSRLYMKV